MKSHEIWDLQTLFSWRNRRLKNVEADSDPYPAPFGLNLQYVSVKVLHCKLLSHKYLCCMNLILLQAKS